MAVKASVENGEVTILEAMDIPMGFVTSISGHGWVLSGSWSIMRLTIPETGAFGIGMDNGIRRFGEL